MADIRKRKELLFCAFFSIMILLIFSKKTEILIRTVKKEDSHGAGIREADAVL